MPTPASPEDARPPALAVRSRRALIALFILLWTAFVAVSAYQWIRYAPAADEPLPARIGLSLFFLAGPAWILARRLRGLRRPLPTSLTASAVLTASVVVFLAWLAQDDETWLHSGRHPALRNDFPEAAPTHALTLRFNETPRGTLFSALPNTKLVPPSAEPGTKNDVKWTEFIAKNGPAIDQLWTDSAVLRGWIGELAAAPAIGDLTEDFRSPIPRFQAFRLAGQISSSHAMRLAAEGRRDAAVDAILPVYIAAQKLEPHSRTLVRRMIAIALRRQAHGTLGRILDGGPVSPETRARLAAVLAPRADDPEQARLLLRCEYEISGPMFLRLQPADAEAFSPTSTSARRLAVSILRPLQPLLYNPVRTANLTGDYFEELGEAAARRDHQTIKERGETLFSRSGLLLPGKNYAGRLMMAMAVPAFGKVVESYWKAEDERAALFERVKTGEP